MINKKHSMETKSKDHYHDVSTSVTSSTTMTSTSSETSTITYSRSSSHSYNSTAASNVAFSISLENVLESSSQVNSGAAVSVNRQVSSVSQYEYANQALRGQDTESRGDVSQLTGRHGGDEQNTVERTQPSEDGLRADDVSPYRTGSLQLGQ